MSRRADREWTRTIRTAMKIKELFENATNWEKFKQGINYNCSGNRLTSLEGAPQKVDGYFDCSGNRLTSLEGAPQEVGGNFYCGYNRLTSLEGAPQEVDGDFYCFNNRLTSLEGTPSKVDGVFSCFNNPIKSLKGIGKNYVKEINGFIDLDECPIESHMLGLLKVKGLTKIKFNHNNKVQEIINNHLKTKDILSCQEELIENGLEQYAHL